MKGIFYNIAVKFVVKVELLLITSNINNTSDLLCDTISYLKDETMKVLNKFGLQHEEQASRRILFLFYRNVKF